MTRSKIRENVFKMLFRVEFHDKSELAEQMELLNDELTNPTDEEKQYIDEKCSAIIEHMAELDALIDEKSTGWKTNRMAKVDLAIIRLAVYEIKFTLQSHLQYNNQIPVTAVPLSVAVNGYRPLIANRLSKLSAQNKIGSRSPTSLLMQEMGLEPTRYCYHRHLKPARLPIPPLLRTSIILPKSLE